MSNKIRIRTETGDDKIVIDEDIARQIVALATDEQKVVRTPCDDCKNERDKALAELAAEKERSAKLEEQRDAGWIHPEEVKSEIQALRHENDKLRAELAVKTKRLRKAEAELSDSSDAPVRAVDGQTFYEDK